MDKISRNQFNGKNYWRKKGYNLLDGVENKRKIQVVKINGGDDGGGSKFRRFWRVKKGLKFKGYFKKIFLSPKKVWNKFKDGYVNMMLKMAGEVGKVNGGSEFERKKISQARQVRVKYKNQQEFEARLVIEIYKALQTSKGVSEVV
ncbi:uncharacterized protein LOC130803309 [Amaranthus tricolor]|uniref:uncharacterized protein LOC130803309 n=1 Tax=Amaranthus tricolor TaxID=29722 RepID=UPI00258ADEE6|nr:uncharacterized protein LOC130803309 [Amaranthus tricolor]